MGKSPIRHGLSNFRPSVWISLTLLILFLALFIGMNLLYRAEGVEKETVFAEEQTKQTGYVIISAKVISIDPIRGDMNVRLQFFPQGDYLVENEGVLSKDLVLDINSASGRVEYKFKKDEPMNPTDVVLDIYGDISEYPFDQHEGDLILEMSETDSVGDQPSQFKAVPFAVGYSGAVSGYRITASRSLDSETGYLEINMKMARSLSTILFSAFIMLLEWLLAISALSVMVIWARGRKIEATMFSWMAGLLFAMLPLRNAMPAAPPIGVLSDFLAFFWAECIVASSLVASITIWSLRKPPAS